jgi:hypothetical protein
MAKRKGLRREKDDPTMQHRDTRGTFVMHPNTYPVHGEVLVKLGSLVLLDPAEPEGVVRVSYADRVAASKGYI